MTVTVERIPFEQKPVFVQMLELYLYDFSEFSSDDVNWKLPCVFFGERRCGRLYVLLLRDGRGRGDRRPKAGQSGARRYDKACCPQWAARLSNMRRGLRGSDFLMDRRGHDAGITGTGVADIGSIGLSAGTFIFVFCVMFTAGMVIVSGIRHCFTTAVIGGIDNVVDCTCIFRCRR